MDNIGLQLHCALIDAILAYIMCAMRATLSINCESCLSMYLTVNVHVSMNANGIGNVNVNVNVNVKVTVNDKPI